MHFVFCFQDFMGKSDPYLEFSRQMPDGKFVAVHRTEVLSFNLSRLLFSQFGAYFLFPVM